MNWKRLLLLALLLLVVVAQGYLRLAPIPSALLRPPVQSIALLDRNGVPLREARVAERFSRALKIEDVPPRVIQAMLAAEDKRFYRHHGVDWLATARALTNGLTSGHITSGASTITQQLIKISQKRPRTFCTKVIESLQAMRLERAWPKERILCAYLNRLDFGNLNIGLAAAANFYFGKPVADLSEAEAALLAALPRNPRRLNPYVASARAQARQQMVLRRMRENGWLHEERLRSASAEALQLRPARRLFRAPHFAELVLREATMKNSAELRTTLDLSLNDEVERILRERLAQLSEHHVHNGAAVVIDNASGDVLALVGSADYFSTDSGQVNGAWAKRSAGSTLKPFTYLLALERGATPASLVADVRTSFPSTTGFYRPENYNRRCYGPVTYRTALGSSLNIPAVKVLQAAGGPAALHQRLRECGLTTLAHPPEVYGLGLTLGNCEARLLELTNAYASLARLGVYRPWRVLQDGANELRPYSRPDLVWQIADILSDNAARTLAFGIESALRFDFPVACKTGTSTDFRDNWTLGFTPEFTVGVWVGNFDGSPMREISGVTGAGPIFHGVFDFLHAQRGTTWYRAPDGVVEAEIDPLSGKLVAETNSNSVRERFVRGQLPATSCAEDYDSAGRTKLPNEYAEWFSSAENGLRDRVVLADAAEELRITAPLADSTYLVDPDVPSSRCIPLVANGGAKLIWVSESLECVVRNGAMVALAKEGDHQITVMDQANGRRAEVHISVRSL